MLPGQHHHQASAPGPSWIPFSAVASACQRRGVLMLAAYSACRLSNAAAPPVHHHWCDLTGSLPCRQLQALHRACRQCPRLQSWSVEAGRLAQPRHSPAQEQQPGSQGQGGSMPGSPRQVRCAEPGVCGADGAMRPDPCYPRCTRLRGGLLLRSHAGRSCRRMQSRMVGHPHRSGAGRSYWCMETCMAGCSCAVQCWKLNSHAALDACASTPRSRLPSGCPALHQLRVPVRQRCSVACCRAQVMVQETARCRAHPHMPRVQAACDEPCL